MAKKINIKNKKKQTNPMLDILTPIGLRFNKNTLHIGESFTKIYGIIKYPNKVKSEWLSKITNIPNTVVTIGIKPVDNTNLISAISRNIAYDRSIASSSKDTLTRQRAEKSAEDGEKIIMQIDRENETVALMTVCVATMARDEQNFKRVCRRSESMISVLKCKMRAIPNLQKELFKHIYPTFTNREKIENILQKIVPISTFVGGFPFARSGFNDGTGYYFASDSNGGLVITDIWKRESDRTNSNIVIMGNSGVGKSTVIKHIIISEYMNNTKIVCIDPESEYKELCKNLGGNLINAVGGTKGKINPLQIRPLPKDDESETEKLFNGDNGINDLALHIKNLEIFFSLYNSSLTDMQMAILKNCLIKLYNNFGIDWDTDVSRLKSEDFPTFKDLYDLILEEFKITKNNTLSEISILLSDIAIGSDSFIWNGHTTVEDNSNFICFDTNGLQGTYDSVKRTQYFNILTCCWEKICKNRDEKIMLICDESYLMIDGKVPRSLVYLRNMMKRVRKYEGSLAVISHSVVDFLSDNIKQYGQALLDIPTYKILMGTDGQNLKETTRLYDLTEAEQDLLLAKKRGHALFMAGAKRLHINFTIPEYKLEYMGKGGGR
ncbi:DUF87 domain-containing protein [uncultured Tyzzerella sp.]|uniref:VirB4 family type IV secretion system protein n=1 Tax=uncultured Tyzzerella sp. TaxID=2321398 RepID=UPI002942B37C|nr:DUF87 domain-containing protein [uncultured Tyzzerella sp.]